MALWDYCAICGKRIESGDPCLGVEKKNAETAGDSICFDCVKIENINGLDKTVSITDLLARAEAAEARAEKAETERDAAVADLRLVSDCRTCGNVTPWCIDNPDKCKGWEWRGRKEE